MNLPSSVILLLFAVRAWASQATWPYEATLLYFAYRLQCEDPKLKIITIARDCVGADGGRCNMDEFLRHIVKEPWSGSTTLGENPDVNKAVKQIQSSGYDKTKYDTSKLYPSKPNAYHAQVMESVAADMKFSIKNIAGFQSPFRDACVNKFEKAREYGVSERQREISKYKIATLGNLLGDLLQTKKATTLSGRAYISINTATSVARAQSEADRTKIRDAVNLFEKRKSGTVTQQEHQRVINVLEGDVKDVKVVWEASKTC